MPTTDVISILTANIFASAKAFVARAFAPNYAFATAVA